MKKRRAKSSTCKLKSQGRDSLMGRKLVVTKRHSQTGEAQLAQRVKRRRRRKMVRSKKGLER